MLGLKCQLKKMKTLFFQVDFGYSSLITMGIKKENQHEKLLLPLHEDDKKVANNEKLLPPPAKRKVEKMWKSKK